MKNSVIIILFVFLSNSIFCQVTIDSLKQNSIKINNIKVQPDEYGLNEYRIDKEQKLKIESIIRLDVYEYFQLLQYDSDLKKKVFEQTEEYQIKLKELKSIKNDLLKKKYYIDYDIAENEKSSLKYNLKTQSFTFSNTTFGNLIIPEAKLILGTIVLDKPQGFILKNTPININKVVAVKQTINFKIPTEDIALKIEENAENIKILFIFQFTAIKAFNNNYYADFIRKDNYLLTKLDQVIVYNSSNNEILKIYKYTPPSPTKK